MPIEYPIEISSIDCSAKAVEKPFMGSQGDLVKIRPCGDEYGKKTYLGFLLGDIALSTGARYNTETKELQIHHLKNPAIFVPELGKIIYGMESWWGKVKDESELADITDDDISNVWYVKLWKAMQEKKDSE